MAFRNAMRVPGSRRSGIVRSALGVDPVLGQPSQSFGGNPALSQPSQSPFAYSLPENYGFNELAGYEEARRNQFGQDAQKQILDTRARLATSLNDQGQKFFQMNNPAILEDLNNRGVFTSATAVNQAQAQALKEIELANQSKLTDFDTAATSAQLQAEQDALDAALDLRRGNLEAGLAESAAAREESLARDLAKQQGRNSLYGSLIGAGGNILGAGLMGGGGGLFGGGGGGGGLFSGIKGLFGGAGGRTALINGVRTPIGPARYGGQFGLGGGAGVTAGSLFGGAGAGLLGSSLGRSAFGGGNDVGGAVGGGLGFLLGGPIGAGVGSFVGTGAQRLGENIDNQVGNKLGNTAASIVRPFVNPVGSVKKIAKKLCFDALTPVLMADGSVKPICKIDLDDKTKGGKVESIRISRVEDGTRYLYKGVTVTEAHAVKENGQWIRIKDSTYATPLNGGGVVFSIITDKHRVFSGEVEFADEAETNDNENLNLDESLQELNNEVVALNGY